MYTDGSITISGLISSGQAGQKGQQKGLVVDVQGPSLVSFGSSLELITIKGLHMRSAVFKRSIFPREVKQGSIIVHNAVTPDAAPVDHMQ